MHPILAAAVHAVAPYQVPPDTVPAFKKQRPVLGTPVAIDARGRRRSTLVALGDHDGMRIRELCQVTGLRPGAQRRVLGQLIRLGHVVVLQPDGRKNTLYAVPPSLREVA